MALTPAQRDHVAAHRRADAAVDAVSAGVADRITAILERYAGRRLTLADRRRMMQEIDRVIASVYGDTQAAALSADLYRTIVGEMQRSAMVPYHRAVRAVESAVIQGAPRLWDTVRLLADPVSNDPFLRAVSAVTNGNPVAKRRILNAKRLDPQRRWVKADKTRAKGASYRLSDRVWKLGQNTRAAIDARIREGIRNGEDALSIAADLEQFLKPAMQSETLTHNGMVIRRRNQTEAPGRGGWGNYATRRLARTEITHVLGEATITSAEDVIGVRGVQWSLSNRHPEPDECFVAGMMVETIDGPKPIEDVEIGTLVLTHRGRYMPVTRLFRTQASSHALIRLLVPKEQGHSRPIVTTQNHPVLTDHGWIAAGDLRRGDRVSVWPSAHDGLLARSHYDDPGRASRDSEQNALAVSPRIGSVERCGASLRGAIRTLRMPRRDWLLPIGSLRYACGIFRCLETRRTSSDSLVPIAPVTLPAVALLASTTCRGVASRSSGWTIQTLGRSSSSSRLPPIDRCSETLSRKSGKPSSPSHEQRDSKLANKIDDRAPSCMGPDERASRRSRRGIRPRFSWLRRDKQLSRIDASQSGKGAPCPTASEAFRFRTVHSTSSYVHPWMPSRMHPLYNLEVDQDHSYVVEGVVVHNCDRHAEADPDGLGPGVYLPRNVPPFPSHPQDLCILAHAMESRKTIVKLVAAKYADETEIAA